MYRPSIRRVFAVCSIIVTCLWMGGVAFAAAGDQGNQTYLGLGAGFGFENFDQAGGFDFDNAYDTKFLYATKLKVTGNYMYHYKFNPQVRPT